MMNNQREGLKMNRKPLQRRASSEPPLVNPHIRRLSLQQRRISVAGEIEATRKTQSTFSYSRHQEFPSCSNELKLQDSSTTSQNGMIKLPGIGLESGVQCQDLGHNNKFDAFGKTKLTAVRKSSLPDDYCFTTKPCLTSRRHTSLRRQFLWNADRQEQSKALRQFTTNAEANFDSNKEKAMIISNWLSSQTSLKKS